MRRFLWATAACAAVAFCWPGQVQADVVVGIAVPAGGAKEQTGAAIKAAALSAIDAVNATGGVQGGRIVAVIVDDACTTAGGTESAARLIAQNAQLVIGHPCSNAALAAAQVYAAAGVLFVAIGARHPALTLKRAGPTIFRTGGRDDRQADDTVAAFAPQLSGRRAAVVHDRTAYARALADDVAAGLRTKARSTVVTITLVAGEKDYSRLIGQIHAANAEAVYFCGFPAEAEIIFAGVRKNSPGTALIGCDAADGLVPPEGGIDIMVAAYPDVAAETRRLIGVWAQAPHGVSALADSSGDIPPMSAQPSFVPKRS